MTRYFLLVKYTATEDNKKRAGETLMFIHTKGGYVYNAATNIFLENMGYKNKWQAEREAEKMRYNEEGWHKEITVIPKEF